MTQIGSRRVFVCFFFASLSVTLWYIKSNTWKTKRLYQYHYNYTARVKYKKPQTKIMLQICPATNHPWILPTSDLDVVFSGPRSPQPPGGQARTSHGPLRSLALPPESPSNKNRHNNWQSQAASFFKSLLSLSRALSLSLPFTHSQTVSHSAQARHILYPSHTRTQEIISLKMSLSRRYFR